MKIKLTIYYCLIISIFIFLCSCKKENISPTTNTITIHDTIVKTIAIHDTISCIPKSDIIEGVWYCYKYLKGPQPTSSERVVFTQSSYDWNGAGAVSFSGDYSVIYYNGSPNFTISVKNCSELTLSQQSGQAAYLRRAP